MDRSDIRDRAIGSRRPRISLPLNPGYALRLSKRPHLARHGFATNRRKQTMTANELFAAAPELMKKWAAVSVVAAASLEPTLIRLVEIRVSQINGCANCINMHAEEARANGETNQRIDLLSAWREAPCYSERERAALGWTEALTRLSEGHAHEGAYKALKAQFSEAEQVKLTVMINVINGWNRISVGFGMFVDPAVAKSTAQAAAA
jgi:AhpD family alkylhydroperoxidase